MNIHLQHTSLRFLSVVQGQRVALSALSTIALTAVAVASPAPQIVTKEVVSVAGPTSGMESFFTLHSDEAGSWVTTARTLTTSDSVLYGLQAGSGAATPGTLRVPQVLSGYTQLNLLSPRVLNSRIAYTASTPSPALGLSSWIDDFLVAAPGVTIGTTGLEWVSSGTPYLTTGTRVFVKGQVQPVGGQGPTQRVVVRYPEQVVELSVGDSPVGINGQLTEIKSFEASPDGTWWTAVVDYESTTTGSIESAVLRNGQVHLLVGSSRAWTEQGSWESFSNAYVSNDSAVTFMGRDHTSQVVYRNGRPAFRSAFSQLVDVGRDGLALTRDITMPGRPLLFDGLHLDRPSAGGVDADGDGTVDAGWSVAAGAAASFTGATFLEDGRVLEVTALQAPDGEIHDAIVVASLALPAAVVCDGASNSTGGPATLRAVGTDQVLYSDLQLRLSNIPQGSLVLPLVSSVTDLVPNAGGSFGNLCLGGSIGRGGIVFTSQNSSVTFRVYPNSLPQPNGTVAAQAGQTWYFQVWHRDHVMGVSGSNFSSALGVTFR